MLSVLRRRRTERLTGRQGKLWDVHRAGFLHEVFQPGDDSWGHRHTEWSVKYFLCSVFFTRIQSYGALRTGRVLFGAVASQHIHRCSDRARGMVRDVFYSAYRIWQILHRVCWCGPGMCRSCLELIFRYEKRPIQIIVYCNLLKGALPVGRDGVSHYVASTHPLDRGGISKRALGRAEARALFLNCAASIILRRVIASENQKRFADSKREFSRL
jgi:hypothetical protein